MSYNDFILANREFWRRHEPNPRDLVDRYVVVDYDTQEVTRLMLNSILAKLLQKKYGYKLIALINGNDEEYFRRFAYSYGIHTVYKQGEPIVPITELDYAAIIRDTTLRSGADLRAAVTGLHVNGLWIGDLVYDSYLRRYDKYSLELPSTELAQTLFSGLKFHQLVEWLTSVHDVAAAVVSHSIYIQYGMLMRMVLAGGGIAMATRQKMPKSILRTYHRLEDSDENEAQVSPSDLAYMRQTAGEELIRACQAAIDKRFGGDESAIHTTTPAFGGEKRHYGRKELIEKLSLDPDKPIIFLMSQVFAEARTYKGYIFEDHYQWMIHSLEFLRENRDANWIVRFHPDHDHYNPTMNPADLVGLYSEENDHIHLCPLEMGLRRLPEVCDVGVGIGDIALEMACVGIPVVAPARSGIFGHGCTYDATTRDEYFRLLEQAPHLPRLSEEQRRTALLAASRFFCDFVDTRLIPFTPQFQRGVDTEAVFAEATKLLRKADFDRDPMVRSVMYHLDQGHEHLLPYEIMGLV